MIRITEVPWLRDHAFGNDIVLPPAAYVAMAGEAVSRLQQKEDSQTGYTVRKLHLTSAILLHNNKHTEVMTTLRPKILTAKQDRSWYEFTLISHDGNSWTRHYRGLIAIGSASKTPDVRVNTFPRKVDSDCWYKTMARVGLNCGPRFNGLRDSTCSATDPVASVKVTDRQQRQSHHMRFTLRRWTLFSSFG